MLRFILRTMICAGYLWAMVLLVTLGGCGTSNSATTITTPITSVVEVETYTRASGKAPGMDLVCTISSDRVCVDSITVTYVGDVRDGAYSDLCCAWYRVEDMWGVTWYGNPMGSTLLVSPPTSKPSYVLTKGTWIAHLFFQGEVVPTVQGVSCTERPLNK